MLQTNSKHEMPATAKKTQNYFLSSRLMKQRNPENFQQAGFDAASLRGDKKQDQHQQGRKQLSHFGWQTINQL